MANRPVTAAGGAVGHARVIVPGLDDRSARPVAVLGANAPRMRRADPLSDTKSRPRVTLVTPSYPTRGEPYRGIYNFQRGQALQEWAEVEVVCALARYPPLLTPASAHRRQNRQPRPLGLPAHLVEYPALPLVSRALNARSCALRLAPTLRSLRPDLVLAYWVYPEGLAAVRVAHQMGIPAVVGAVGSDLRAIAEPMTRRGVQAALREADYVVTVSRNLREIAVRLGAAPERVRAIPNGCDGEVFRPGERKAARAELGVAATSRLVLFVGRLTPVKGVRELLAAMAAAAPGSPALELTLIGEGPLETELRERARSAALAPRVRFAGRCEPHEVARWLAAADVLCLPSRSEGCPNSVLEALRCGRPVVASAVGGIPELVDGTCGRLTPVGDAAAIAAAIVEVVGREWDAAAIAARQRRSWRDVAGDTWEVCQRALAPGRGEDQGGEGRAEWASGW